MSLVAVAPGFVKLDVDIFLRKYIRAVEGIQICFCTVKEPPLYHHPTVVEKDLHSCTFHTLFKGLELLECMIQLICASVPPGGIVGDDDLAQRVRAFISFVNNDMLKPADQQARVALHLEAVDIPDIVERFNVAKRRYQYKIMQVDKKNITSDGILQMRAEHHMEWLSRVAYSHRSSFERDHLLALMEFAHQLAQLCRFMVCNVTKPAWLSSFQSWRRLLRSLAYLNVQQ
jgi:hypothetical protein